MTRARTTPPNRSSGATESIRSGVRPRGLGRFAARLTLLAVLFGSALPAGLPLGVVFTPNPALAQTTDGSSSARSDDRSPGPIDELKSLFRRWPEPGWLAFQVLEDGSLVVTMGGHVHLATTHFELFADEVGVYLAPRSGDSDPVFRLFARGSIVVLRGEQSVRGETFFFDSGSNRGVVTDVRLRIDIDEAREDFSAFRGSDASTRDVPFAESLGPRERAREERERELRERIAAGAIGATPSTVDGHEGRQLAIAAARIEMDQLLSFSADDVSVTTCDFERPHWEVWARRAKVEGQREPEPETGGERIEYRGWLEGVRFKVWDRTILPLPNFAWDTRYHRYFPLRKIGYSRSSKFGDRVDTLWDASFLLPRSLRSHIDLTLRGDYLSKRGLGYGADLRYGEKPRRWTREPRGFDLYGEGVFYAIDDRGEDRNDVVPETNDRNRARWHQRIRLPSGTLIDAEYAVEKDRNFLEEYYQSELRREKTPENLVYLRQPLDEDVAVTVLAKKRLVPYRSVVERLPEVGLFVVERPVFDSGVHVDVRGRGSYLRFLPDDRTPLPSERQARGDVQAVVSRAWGSTRYGKVRPFIEVRGTAWEEDLIRGDSIERFTVATGGRVGWHLGRNFDFRSRAFGIDRLRHVVQPEVAYRLVFENNVNPGEVFAFDSTESVDHFEVLTLGVRQFLFARSTLSPTPWVEEKSAQDGDSEEGVDDSEGADPPRTGSLKLAEAEVEIDYFPDAGRDNASDNFGPVRGELLVYPFPGQGVFAEAEYDVETGGEFRTFNTGVQLSLPRELDVRVSKRYRRHLTDSVLGEFYWPVSEKYEFQGFVERDLRRHRWVNQEFGILRHFHQWSMLLSLEFDDGEDDVVFKVNFGPRGYFGLRRRR